MAVSDGSLIEKGLPFQRFDLLIVMNDLDSSNSTNSTLTGRKHKLISRLGFACDGDILEMDAEKNQVFSNKNEARLINRLLEFEAKHDAANAY